MDAQKLEQIQEIFSNDRFVTDSGAIIEQMEEGYAECWLEVQPHHLNATSMVMGDAIFTLANFVSAVASNWDRPLHVSVTSRITYLGVARGIRLIAEARKVKEGRSTCYCLVEMEDNLGNEVARVTASGFSKGQS